MYSHIKSADDLRTAIRLLEERQQLEKDQLVSDFHGLTESMKPMNLLKSSIHKITSKPGLMGSVINASVGIGAGLLSKKLLIGPSTGIVKKIAGNAIKLGVAGLINKKSDKIKYTGLKWITKILGR